MHMLIGAKEIAAFLRFDDVRRLKTIIDYGAPIRIIGNGTGSRYLASAKAVARWARLADNSPRSCKT
jgi:hypothetical protein